MSLEAWAECYPLIANSICDQTCSAYFEMEAILKRAVGQIDPCVYGSNYEQALYSYAMLLLAESPCGQQILGLDPVAARQYYSEAFERAAKASTTAPIIV